MAQRVVFGGNACVTGLLIGITPSGKQSTEEALFDWIVSDFGLNDAIESGLVKTPRVVVRDDGRLTSDYKSRLYHIYSDPEVKDDLNRKAEEQEPLPDLVLNGYNLLGKDWLETLQQWSGEHSPTPPVMITVANRTETAARVKYAFDHGGIKIDELRSPARTLHIDSKVLEKAESQIEAAEIQGQNGEGAEEEATEAPVRKETKDQQAERLRKMVDTVGKAGQPGGQIQKVISVGMLSEGWDAKRSHINFCVYDSTWEASEAFILDRGPNVDAWVKNDHLGFEVLYVFKGVVKKYRPDFLIRLTSGKMLVLEVKAQETQQDQSKRTFLDEWCRAVNEHGGFGLWECDVSYEPSDLNGILARHNLDSDG